MFYSPRKDPNCQFRFHTGSIKRDITKAIQISTYEFRFHTGSIKSLQDFWGRLSPRGFDSILVRLKVREIPIFFTDRVRFDSILVRLKVNTQTNITSKTTFRFHTGSIKSPGNQKQHNTSLKFRFHTGSIKSVLIVVYGRELKVFVSIPYWFD